MRMAAVLCLVLFLFPACQKESKPVYTPVKVKVAFTNQPQSTLLHIAVENGYFQEEGIEVETGIFGVGKHALEKLANNEADIATVAETPIMFNVLQGGKFQVLANILVSNANNAILARRDAGISKPADLRGKRIGYVSQTTSDFFLASLLTSNDMTDKDVKKIAMDLDELRVALLDGKIDAVSIWNYPLVVMEQRLGKNAVIFYDKEMYTGTFNLVALSDFIRKNPLLIQRFLRAMIKAEHFLHDEPEAAQDIMVRRTAIDKQLIRKVWLDYQFHVGLDQILLITLEDEARWAISNKLVNSTEVPDFTENIYFAGMQAVRPESIRLKH